MANHYSKKRGFKYVMLALACTAAFSLTGSAVACKKTEDSGNDEEDKKTSVVDEQLLKNGNFEIYEVPDDAVHLIKTPTSWTKGGSSSYTMSGIIGTSDKAWSAITDAEISGKLDANNDLDPKDSDYKDLYVDYNGMKSSDLLYKDVYKALNKEDDETEEQEKARKEFIENPKTHYNVHTKDGLLYGYVGDEEVRVYENEDGDYFLDEKFEEPISHVLMVHNYATAHNGISQNYSSVSIDLPANTSAEISLWVKTAYLKHSQGVSVEQDRGANITVTHNAGSTTLDDFAITSINTEKLTGENGSVSEEYKNRHNGWVEYTVYVNACDFAASTVTLKLGLGETDYLTEGYAFFDDVKVTKYASLDDSTYPENKTAIENGNASCSLLSDATEKKFVADVYERNGGAAEGGVTEKRSSENFHYLIDLASESNYKPYTFGSATAKITVDEDNYASVKNYSGKKLGFGSVQNAGSDVKTPKDFPELDTSKDLLAYVKAGHTFTQNETVFSAVLNEALKGADSLPKLDKNTDSNMLVIASYFGAAYTTSFNLSVDGKDHKIVSFWVKTYDMKGGSAATVKISDADDKDVNAGVTVDSTGVKTDIDDDNKDIYNGWVQCFFFVKNESDTTKNLTVDFSFGNTTIKDTTVNNYKSGWAALANVQTLDVDEDVFAYTGSGDYNATITLKEDEEKKTGVFDEIYGSQTNEIKDSIVNPANYQGVNGGSSSIVNNGTISLPFDDINKNKNAGLINKEYFKNYSENKTENGWYDKLLNAFNKSGVDAADAWNGIFGSASQQPLIIVNSLRQEYLREKGATADNYESYYFKNDDGVFVAARGTGFDEEREYYSLKDVMNYGFVGSTKTISADGYSTVSVKVKVSSGAVAYVYLVNTASGKEVLKFSAPNYTFRYDEDGNVLKAEPKKNASISEQRANILYSLLDNGLYADENGKLFANIWNYTKVYKNEALTYYKDGKIVNFEDIKDGATYYSDEQCMKIADHYLAATDGAKLYEYKDGKYFYLVKGNATVEVNPFDTAYAKYDYTGIEEEYFVKIDGNDAEVANKWITVNFVINAGSDAKNYRLELWSGARDSLDSGECKEGSAVLFDYSYTSVSDNKLMSWYESEIIDAYKQLLIEKNLLDENAAPTSTENIKYYAELLKGKITEADLAKYEILKNYTAHYYTFSLYDSANFHPFNKDAADENQTGYDYNANDYSETLAYLSVKDNDTYTVFTDYSAIDKSFSLGTDSDDGDSDEDEDNGDSTTVWLLVSSILLVVALLFTIISLMVRDMLRKSRRNKAAGNNTYNRTNRNRYIKKLNVEKEADANSEGVAEEATEAEKETAEKSAEPETETETIETAESETEEATVEGNEESFETAEPEQEAEETTVQDSTASAEAVESEQEAQEEKHDEE